jgi:glucuronoarabinoxylan endo-1,4-beta-xylanase
MVVVASPAGAAVSSQWQGGFGASVSISNLGDPVSGWTLT